MPQANQSGPEQSSAPAAQVGASDGSRELTQLDRTEAMRLLASVSFGRVVFTENALPAIRPVNHLIENDRVIMRTQLTTKVTKAVQSKTASGVVVAYEADEIDPRLHTGWSVVVTGLAHTVTDREQIDRYERLLQPWVNKVMDTVIVIEPQIVTGVRIGATRA